MNNLFPINASLTVVWHFSKPDGSPFSLNGYTYRLYYRSGKGKTEVQPTAVTADGDTLSFNFPADAQRFPGQYSLQLVLFQNGNIFCTLNYNDAFAFSRFDSAPQPSQTQETADRTIHLFTAAEYYLFTPVIPVVGTDGYWYVNGVKVTDGNGEPVPSSHTVVYDAESNNLIIDQGRVDSEGHSIEQVVTSIAQAVAAEAVREENEQHRIATEGRMQGLIDSIVVNFLADTDVYEQAVEHGFVGTREEWLASPLGVKGVGIARWDVEPSEEDSGYSVHTITLNNGEVLTFNVKNGRGIASVQQTAASQEDGGTNIVTITMSDGSAASFQVKNGNRGNSGFQGDFTDYKIVNNLSGGDGEGGEWTGKESLSSEQGKVLADMVKETTKLPYAEFELVGNGDNYVNGTLTSLLPGHTYRFYVKSWPHDEVTSGVNWLFFIGYNNGTAVQDLLVKKANETLGVYYDLAIPSNSVSVTIGGRLNANAHGYVDIEDITATRALEGRLDDITENSSSIWSATRQDADDTIADKFVSNNGLISDNTSMSIYVYPVTSGEEYSFSGRAGDSNSLPFISWFGEDETYIGKESYSGPSANYIRQKVTAPEGAAYAYLNVQKIYKDDAAFYSVGQPDEIGLREDIDALIDNLSYTDAEVLSLERRSGFINQYANIYQYSNTRHVIVPVAANQFVRVETNKDTGNNANLAWLASDTAPVMGDTPDLVPGTVTWVAPGASGGKVYYYRVPQGAQYLYVYLGNPPYPYAPSFVGVSSVASDAGLPSKAVIADSQEHLLRARRDIVSKTMGLLPLSVPVDEDGWEIPQTVQQLNTIKKALQLVRIKWTPKYTLPGKHDPTGTAHQAGVEQTGIPYSGNWHEYKYVGIEVSLHTFMTAVNNPYSLLYTENISKTGSRSAWGKTYNNTNGWMYYGTVCCGLSASTNGQKTKYGNDVIPKAGKTFGVFVPLDPQDVRVLKIGDIGNSPLHSWVVTGLHRTNGEIDKITVAESTGDTNSCRLVTRTATEFPDYLERNSYIMYRVPDLYRNIDYQPSPYVPLTDYGETAEAVTYNNDICCFAGDEATFAVGDRVVINYNIGATPSREWTAIQLYKNGNLTATYTLADINQSALPEGQRGHALDLGTTLASGRYRARLTDGTNYSAFTYWEVVPTNVVVTVTDDYKYKIKLSSEIYKIRYVYCGQVQEAGFFYTRAGREPNWYEEQENAVYLCYDELMKEWGYDPSENNQVRVMIEGIYGMAATPPITLPGRTDEEGDDDTPDDPSDDDNA